MEVTKEEIIKWLDEQVAEGKEVSMGWEGGGDSGWVYFEVDGEKVDNDFTHALVNHMYDYLDYGSWAGEFSASGKAVYNPENKCFEGTDYYSEDSSVNYPCSIVLKIPDDVWFDRIEWSAEGETEEKVYVDVELIVRNGFKTDRHEEIETMLKKSFDDQLDKVVDRFINAGEMEYRNVWDNGSIENPQFTKKNNKLVHTIPSISIGTCESQDKDICLNLNELFELENDEINE
jgi:hypothetical protein